jgi:hypothetical protein
MRVVPISRASARQHSSVAGNRRYLDRRLALCVVNLKRKPVMPRSSVDSRTDGEMMSAGYLLAAASLAARVQARAAPQIAEGARQNRGRL